MLQKSYGFFPEDSEWRSNPRLDSSSPIWNGPSREDIFEFRYRFCRDNFLSVLQAMHFVEAANGCFKELLVSSIIFFNFFSYGQRLHLGGRNIDRLYVTTNFLMDVRCGFYGN